MCKKKVCVNCLYFGYKRAGEDNNRSRDYDTREKMKKFLPEIEELICDKDGLPKLLRKNREDNLKVINNLKCKFFKFHKKEYGNNFIQNIEIENLTKLNTRLIIRFGVLSLIFSVGLFLLQR
jgi:hypothetical protein